MRAPCVAPTRPAEPVTASALAQFSLEQAEHAKCEKTRADGAIDAIDAHNEAAR